MFTKYVSSGWFKKCSCNWHGITKSKKLHSVNHYCKWETLPLKDIGISIKWWGVEGKKKESAVTKRKMCLVARLCLTLCDPMDCNPPGSSVPGDSPGTNTGVGCHALLQGIFPHQESSPGLPHCTGILYLVAREARRGKQQALLWIGEKIFAKTIHLWVYTFCI